jgi:hypothetical protein
MTINIVTKCSSTGLCHVRTVAQWSERIARNYQYGAYKAGPLRHLNLESGAVVAEIRSACKWLAGTPLVPNALQSWRAVRPSPSIGSKRQVTAQRRRFLRDALLIVYGHLGNPVSTQNWAFAAVRNE